MPTRSNNAFIVLSPIRSNLKHLVARTSTLSALLTACQGFFYRLQSLYTIKNLCWAYVFIAQTSIAEMVITIDFEKCVQFSNDHPTCSIATVDGDQPLSLIHISEPTRRTPISYAVFCL